MRDIQILRIDAQRCPDGHWEWNDWYKVGTIPKDRTTSTAKLLRTLRQGDWLRPETAGKLAVNDDGYNLVVVARHTAEPLYAVVYGDVGTEAEDEARADHSCVHGSMEIGPNFQQITKGREP